MSVRMLLRLDDIEFWAGVLMAVTGGFVRLPQELATEEKSAPVLTLVQGSKPSKKCDEDTAKVS